MYLGVAEGEFKKQRYNHTQSFRNENYSNMTIKKAKKKKDTNISMGNNSKCCTIHKRSELVSKRRHENKILLQKFNSND